MSPAKISAADIFGPVPAPVDGAKVLNDIATFYRRFTVITSAQADALALWTMHSWCADAATFTPYVDVTSATLRCGKSRVADVAELLVRKPQKTEGLTKAALVRAIAENKVTLLLDELDQLMKSDRDLAAAITGILNSGFRKGGKVLLCEQDKKGKWVNHEFPTFSPKMLVGIGKRPATVRDRSITIKMTRKHRGETVERFRDRQVKLEAAPLVADIMLWAAENQSRLVDAEPEMPDQLNDRQQDVCEPLVAIADLAGGEWPSRARKALVELCTGEAAEDDSLDTMLLVDIRTAFDDADKLATVDLIAKLLEMEEHPWGECNHGKPMNPAWLSRRLKGFGVQPRPVRIDGGKVAKGYAREHFSDAWERYLPATTPFSPDSAVTRLQPASIADEPHFSERLQNVDVTGAKSEESPVFMRIVTPVTVSNPEMGMLPSKPGNGDACDYLFRAAVSLSREAGIVSVSKIMADLLVTRTTAIRYIDQMEGMGLVGPADGGGPRPFLEVVQ